MELVGNRKCASAVQARHLPTVSTMMYKREKYRGDRLARRSACLISFTLVQTRGRRERGGGCHDGVGGLEASEAEATLDARNTINSAGTAGGCEVGRAGCMLACMILRS